MEAKRRPGRSPRRDHPVKLRSTLPGKLREWLRVQAFRESATSPASCAMRWSCTASGAGHERPDRGEAHLW